MQLTIRSRFASGVFSRNSTTLPFVCHGVRMVGQPFGLAVEVRGMMLGCCNMSMIRASRMKCYVKERN